MCDAGICLGFRFQKDGEVLVALARAQGGLLKKWVVGIALFEEVMVVLLVAAAANCFSSR